jgi:RNA polymerase sigma-70 factor (ECF subfamily)
VTDRPDEVSGLVAHCFRHEAGRLVALIARRFGTRRLALAEDAVQDALVQALRTWPFRGIPDEPVGWLRRVAMRRAVDLLRQADRREQLRHAHADLLVPAAPPAPRTDVVGDDELALLFGCAHPSLRPDAQVTLMLKAVGGFGVREIARALLLPPATVAQRLVRARHRLAEADLPLELPADEAALTARRDAVGDAVYLMFTLGHAPAEGDEVVRADVCHEALRLAQALAGHPVVGTPALHALAALCAFGASRLPARADAQGVPLLLAEQDRRQWDPGWRTVGLRHLERAMGAPRLHRWHVEAELAALHACATVPHAIDWGRAVALYDTLLRLAPSPVVEVNRAIALGFAEGRDAAAAALDHAGRDARLADYPWWWAARAWVAREGGDPATAASHYAAARRLTTSAPQQAWLSARIAECSA